MSTRLYLFDDRRARGWSPFALTRPVGEILFGALLLRERIERSLGIPASGYVATPGVLGFEESGAPPTLSRREIPDGESRLLLSTRYVPPLPGENGHSPASALVSSDSPGSRLLLADGTAVGWLLPAGHPLPSESEMLAEGGDSGIGVAPVDAGGAALPPHSLSGSVLGSPWELVETNPARTALDLGALFPGESEPDIRPLPEIPSVHRLGSHAVTLEEGVSVDPFVVFDARGGPIHLAADVRVHSFTTLRGPAYIGPGTTLLGGTFESLSCGPTSRLRGEISSSVVLGYTNKSHDGYLGHALLGRWVNLGAFTTNSDLKNNYGPIRIATATGEVDTGLIKVGTFIGDHAKTGIGTLLNAGTVVGAGTNLFGGRLPWKWVPPFGWGSADSFGPYRLERFLETAERAMSRRKVSMTVGQREFLSAAWRSVHDPVESGGTE